MPTVCSVSSTKRRIPPGKSRGGQICLELALRHPDRFAAVIACQAADRVPGRQTTWAKHALVNEKLFVPEWVDGLMSPQKRTEQPSLLCLRRHEGYLLYQDKWPSCTSTINH